MVTFTLLNRPPLTAIPPWAAIRTLWAGALPKIPLRTPILGAHATPLIMRSPIVMVEGTVSLSARMTLARSFDFVFTLLFRLLGLLMVAMACMELEIGSTLFPATNLIRLLMKNDGNLVALPRTQCIPTPALETPLIIRRKALRMPTGLLRGPEKSEPMMATMFP